MTVLHLDVETFSECDLGAAGAYKYAEDPSTELLCMGFAFDDGDVRQWKPGEPLPGDLLSHIKGGGQIRAHNAAFERVILNGVAGQKIGFPKIEIEQTVCTAVKAAANGIPRSLAEAAKALGTKGKDDGGRIFMLQLSKPRKPTKADPSPRWTLQNAPEKFDALYRYNLDDVLAEREVDDALPDISESEQRLYCLDQKVNSVGWKVDLDAVHNILFVVERYKEQLAAEFRQLTRHKVLVCGPKRDDIPRWEWVELEPTQREKVSEWVRTNGFPGLIDMTAECLRTLQLQPSIPDRVKRVLKIYSTYGAKSVSKLQAMLDAVCADGRLRGMFLFYGAATGRWSSLIVQLQNMMRPVIKDPNTAIEAFASRDIELIRLLWPDVDPMKVAGSCIRGCLVSESGSDLVYPDFSGVEDRVNLWFFDETVMLAAYMAYDAKEGRHPYSITVCQMLGIDLATFSDEDPRRQIGKVTRLQLGYEGGVSAFVSAAENYGIDLAEMAKIVLPLLPDDALDHAKWMRENHPNNQVSGDIETACNGLKYMYRQQQPKIAQGWKLLKEAAEKAVEFEGETFWLPNRKLAFKVEEYRGRKWLCARMPSGRKIKYYNPSWTGPTVGERWINNEKVEYIIPGFFEYFGQDTYTRQFMRLQTYGGKLDENLDQGFSRDLLCNAMLALDSAGYTIIASEHDKVVLEVPNDFGSVEEIKQLMIAQPSYCAGLPLATDGRRLGRYGK